MGQAWSGLKVRPAMPCVVLRLVTGSALCALVTTNPRAAAGLASLTLRACPRRGLPRWKREQALVHVVPPRAPLLSSQVRVVTGLVPGDRKRFVPTRQTNNRT